MEHNNTYCNYIHQAGISQLHTHYHDSEYGFPLEADNELFGRLILEINQAGLSWLTILKKKQHFIDAYDHFDIYTVSQYNESDIERLLQDSGIIRNQLKIKAAIYNAQRIREIQNEWGSFKSWLDIHHPKTREEWTLLFKQNFRFTGGEIVNEFLMSTGYLPGAHHQGCPIYDIILQYQPAWTKKSLP